MSNAIHIVIDGRAVAKGRPRMTRQGIAYTPAKTRLYEAHGRLLAQSVMEGRPPLTGPISMHVLAVFPFLKSWSKPQRASAAGKPHSTRPDIDNLVKSAMDVCDSIVFMNDQQVSLLTAEKCYGLDPRLEIYVSQILPLLGVVKVRKDPPHRPHTAVL